jgi:chaperone required for assembly of F1-ATPase
MKRFWKEVRCTGNGPYGVALDGRPLRTPARAELQVPTQALAGAIAAEWQAVEDQIDPASLPLTGMANAAIDMVQNDLSGFASRLANYAGSDLVCYRAAGPDGLVNAQRTAWDPVLDWARARLDVGFVIIEGLMPIDQPAAAQPRTAGAIAALGAFGVAALAQMVPISGSALISLMLAEASIDAETAWAAATVDETYQLAHWGEDEDAVAALAEREASFRAAHRFLVLARASG